MKVYYTTKNTGPSYTSDQMFVQYIGTSLEEAEEAVGDFSKYRNDRYIRLVDYPNAYTALPRTMDFKFVRFYMADGWWYSIVQFDLEET